MQRTRACARVIRCPIAPLSITSSIATSYSYTLHPPTPLLQRLGLRIRPVDPHVVAESGGTEVGMSAVRGMRWRAALLVAGALVVVLWRVTAGGPTTIIQIEFGMYPEEFVGATVVIDGEDRG